MAQTTDVERLFSWLKTQDLRYREFAAAREVSDAVATWPTLHQAASEAGRADAAVAPAGDTAARERIAREQMTMPPAAAEAIRAAPPNVPPPSAGGRPLSALDRRTQAVPPEFPPEAATPSRSPVAPASPTEGAAAAMPRAAMADDPAAQERAREAAERLRERLDAAMAVNPRPSAVPEAGAGAEAGAPPREGRFFGGAYRGGGDAPRAAAEDVAAGSSRRGHSLDAVFSRLSGGRSRPLPDPRDRSRGSLGSVFNRLR
jgi:hypothetical protein